MCVLSTLCGNVGKHSPVDIYIYHCMFLWINSVLTSRHLFWSQIALPYGSHIQTSSRHSKSPYDVRGVTLTWNTALQTAASTDELKFKVNDYIIEKVDWLYEISMSVNVFIYPCPKVNAILIDFSCEYFTRPKRCEHVSEHGWPTTVMCLMLSSKYAEWH